jgi:hypothetical protein
MVGAFGGWTPNTFGKSRASICSHHASMLSTIICTMQFSAHSFWVISLQDESACAHAEDCDIAVEQFLEAERFVEGAH